MGRKTGSPVDCLCQGRAQSRVARHATGNDERPHAVILLGGARGVPEQFFDYGALKAGQQIPRRLRGCQQPLVDRWLRIAPEQTLADFDLFRQVVAFHPAKDGRLQVR